MMIKLENVTKIYKTGDIDKVALDGVSLTIEDGEMVAIMGPSGCGKTTLLNMIGCMDDITSGTYYVDDFCVSDLKGVKLARFRKKNVAFVFQQFALMKDYTVYENIELPLVINCVKKKERKEIVVDLIRKMGLSEVAKKKVTNISGGQQQRCAIARALAVRGKILLADEPTGALDQKTGNDIMDVFKQLHAEGNTIVIVTHDPNVASKCKRIIEICDGKIV
ncbi:MAG: ABC transporter ATP-binding protein [Lachnospira sp.]|nr:ABC transporter ATP-binding protein [Lachnospira sp.]